ncbi:MAG: hypothetical protein WDO73_04700 [Ignavibacteriota bacterium]
MNLDAITAAAADPANAVGKPKDSPDKILNAARQFESLAGGTVDEIHAG